MRGGPDGMRGGPPQGMPGGGMMLSEEDRELAMQVLKDINPELAERLEKSQDNPQRVRAMLQRYLPHIQKLVRLKKSDPELYKLKVKDTKIGLECEKLSRQFKEAKHNDETDRMKEIHGNVAELVEEHFEVRQKMREMELEKLERRLKEARKQLEKRAGSRKELIQARVNDLTGEQREPMW